MAVLRTLRFFLNYACQYIREHLNLRFKASHCQGIKRQCFKILKCQYLKTAQMDIAPFHGQRAMFTVFLN